MSHSESKPRDEFTLGAGQAARMSWSGGSLAIVGLLLSGIAYGLDHAQHLHRFWWSAHVAFYFLASLTFGAIAFLAYNYVTRTRWHVVLRRVVENMALNIWLVGVIGLVVMVAGNVGEHGLFHHWMHPEEGDKVMEWKAPYFNITFFVLRSIAYIVIPGCITLLLCGHSFRQDKDGDHRHTQINQRFSTVFTILMALIITFAGFDWAMSLDPHWFSTMFGVYSLAGSLIAIICAMILAKHWLHSQGYLQHTITLEHDHDLGKYLLGFTIFWGYIAYSQFMLIYYANIPEETGWFHERAEGFWMQVSYFLLFGKFLFPFLALMSRHVKRNKNLFWQLAFWCLGAHYIDVYWQIMPTMEFEGDYQYGLMTDLLVLVGFSMIWAGAFVRRTAKRPLVPIKDPFLEASINFENF